MKKCSKCKIEKEISEFYPNKARSDGYNTYCKICSKEVKKTNKYKIYYNKYYSVYMKSDKYKNYIKNLRNTNINYKIRILLRNRMYNSLKNNKKSNTTFNLLGCTIQELKKYLQQTAITNGYYDFDINNYSGKEYHIDHINPVVRFNLKCSYHQKLCFNYENLQILTAKENLNKGIKYDSN